MDKPDVELSDVVTAVKKAAKEKRLPPATPKQKLSAEPTAAPLPQDAADNTLARGPPPQPPRSKATDASTDVSTSTAPRFSTRVLKYHANLGARATLLTLDEVAAASRIARSTLNGLIGEGRGPLVTYLTPRVPLVRLIDFEDWLEQLANATGAAPASEPQDHPTPTPARNAPTRAGKAPPISSP